MADKRTEKKKKKKKSKDFADKQKGIGEEAGEIARSIVLKQCELAGITVPTVLKEISSCMNAYEQKAIYSAPEGEWQYSAKMKAWAVRQKAIDQAISIMGIKAPDKQDVRVGGPVTFKVEFDDKPIDGDKS